jgi:ureidoacrylate peracid hydrolase
MGFLKVRVVTAGGDPIPGKSVRAESFFSWFGLTPVVRQGETGNDGTVELELPDESIEVYVDGELRATVDGGGEVTVVATPGPHDAKGPRQESAVAASAPAPEPRGRLVSIEARPEAITIDTGRTVALVVDMQNDFGAKGGMFDRAGIDTSVIRRAIEPTARALASMRKAGISVIYLKMGFMRNLSDLGPPDSPNRLKHLPLAVGTTVTAPDGRESRILIRDMWNTDILDELAPQTGDTVIYKTRYSGFYGTTLDAVLRQREARWLLVTGCTTNVCVDSTIRDAMFRDYSCLLLEDCTGEPVGHEFSRTNHDASLLVIQTLFGWVSDSAAVIRALG